jgi:hypothetical protein
LTRVVSRLASVLREKEDLMRSVLQLGEQGIIRQCANVALLKTNIGESGGDLYYREGRREMPFSRIGVCHLTLERHFHHRKVTSPLGAGHGDL